MTRRNCRNQDLDLLIMTQIDKYSGQTRYTIDTLPNTFPWGGGVDFTKSKLLKTTG